MKKWEVKLIKDAAPFIIGREYLHVAGGFASFYNILGGETDSQIVYGSTVVEYIKEVKGKKGVARPHGRDLKRYMGSRLTKKGEEAGI